MYQRTVLNVISNAAVDVSHSLGMLYFSTAGLAARWLALGVLVVFASFRRSLTTWIFVAMLVGAGIGYDFPSLAVNLKLLAQIFLRLIKVIVAPLIFATLVSGIAGHSDLKKVGRMGVKAIVFFEVVTTIALFIGLAAINLSKAGVGAQIPANLGESVKVEKLTASDTILHVFPENIAESVADNQVLQVVVFSLIFGIALAMVKKPEKRHPMVEFSESLTEVMFKFTNIVMWFAPLGVLGAIASTIASSGVGILGNLAKLLLTLYVALVVFLACVLLPIALAAKIPLKQFLAARGADYDCIRHRKFRGGIAECHGEARGNGCAAVDRGVRDADWVQLQSDWIDALFIVGRNVCGTGRGNAAGLRPSALHHAGSDVDEQRCSRGFAGGNRDPTGDGVDRGSADGPNLYFARDRSVDGHGEDRGERNRKLLGHCSHCAVGR